MSTAPSTQTLPHADSAASIDFVWHEDRFDHSIRFSGHTLRCVAGAQKDAWPDSPPIQQLSIEEIDGRRVALGVGAAGTSHWSVSIESTADGFRFDWACRSKETPEVLGTTYPQDRHVRLEPGKESRVLVGERGVRVGPASPPDGPGTFRWSYVVRECP